MNRDLPRLDEREAEWMVVFAAGQALSVGRLRKRLRVTMRAQRPERMACAARADTNHVTANIILQCGDGTNRCTTVPSSPPRAVVS
jgi:hypothetical protein